jgi:mannose-6-phosphate isomerase-like protein (cupin superfamily)
VEHERRDAAEELQERIARPWGLYEVLAVGLTYVVRRVTVRPHHSIPLQRHALRDEHWTIVAGRGASVHVRARNLEANVGSTFVVRQGEVHRITAGDETLVFIEVQTGDCMEEDVEHLSEPDTPA